MNYVRLSTVAGVMGVTNGWLRHQVYQKVMDDARENPAKGSPYIMHVSQVLQALISKKMRKRSIGYDLIRATIDKFEFDRAKKHEVVVDTGIKLVLDKPLLTLEARNILKIANDLEYGAEEAA